MPKEVVKHECLYCGKIWDKREEALVCEQYHEEPEGLGVEIPEAKWYKDTKYPWQIQVKMSDGKLLNYYIERDPKDD